MANPVDRFSNKVIAELLRSIAAAYLLKGENRFKIIAYDKAADAIEHLSRELKDIWQEGKLQKVPGVGPGIGSGLDEYFKKGESSHFNEVLKGIPPSVFTLMRVPGIGPKKAFRLVMQFGLTDSDTVVQDLKNVAKADKISTLEGFGKKSQDDIYEALEVYQNTDRREERMPFSYAKELAREVMTYLRQLPEVKRTDALGSLRRCVSTIGDIDLAVVADEPDSKKIVDHFLVYPGKRSVEASGDRKGSIIAAGNIRMDLRVQDKETYGSMLQYFTGSKAHNIKLREFALRKGLSLNEYGIKDLKTGKVKEFPDEEAFYGYLGLQYIPPEIREGTDEIEIALKKQVPTLIELKDIKGDFHIHSSYDLKPSHDMGLNSFEELIEKAQSKGYEYIGFSEHNPKISGISTEEIISIMKMRKSHIDQVCSTYKLPYFIGLEVDILPSGEVALPEKAIEYVDYLIVSIHSSFHMEIKDMTRRVMKALSYPKVKLFGHPTARLLGKRDGIDLNWDEVFTYVKDRHIALEINASPSRLDLPDTLVREAKEKGVKFMIDTDAHAVEHMDFMEYGVSVARRGWVIKEDVINTFSPKALSEWMKS